MLTFPRNGRAPLRIGHRGASAYAPENTIAAIIKAAELGADMVELDVQATADGVPIIMHDSDLSRTTNGRGSVYEVTVEQLKLLDAGEGERVPTLDEAIACCSERGLGMYLELKLGVVIDQLVEALWRHAVRERVIVSSFRPDWLADLKVADPDITTAVLFTSRTLDPVALAHAVGARVVHPCWEWNAIEPHRLLTQEWMRPVRDAGLAIVSWHEERPAEIAALHRLGVDGICSNAPDLLLANSTGPRKVEGQ